MDNDEWLKSLRPGDKVAVTSGYRCDNYAIKAIDRVTKTQIVIGGSRYRIKDGHRCGKESYYSSWIEPATGRIYTEVKKAELLSLISSIPYTITRDAVDKVGAAELFKLVNDLKQIIRKFKQKESAK